MLITIMKLVKRNRTRGAIVNRSEFMQQGQESRKDEKRALLLASSFLREKSKVDFVL